MLAAFAGGAILSYLLRVSVAAAATTIQKDLDIPNLAMGDILSAFFVGYLWVQIPAGWAGHRLGARVALALMGVSWAAAMAVTASAQTPTVLYWSRVALGAGQAGLFAVTIMALRDWFPASRRGMTSAVITSCMSVGAVLANGLTVRFMVPFGWRGTFLIYSGIALTWSLWFAYWFRNRPEEHPGTNAAERALIRSAAAFDQSPAHAANANVAAKAPSTLDALRGMASSPAMWALCIQSFFQAFAYALFITWFPAYLEKAHSLRTQGAGDLTMLPLLATVVGSFAGGALIDIVLVRTGSKWLSRCGLAGGALMLCAAATLIASTVRQPTAAVAVIALGMLFSGIAKPNQWAATIDLCGSHSAVGFAVMNVAGNFGALACPKVLAVMIESIEKHGGDWNSILYLVAGINVAAAIAWFSLNPNRPAIQAGG